MNKWMRTNTPVHYVSLNAHDDLGQGVRAGLSCEGQAPRCLRWDRKQSKVMNSGSQMLGTAVLALVLTPRSNIYSREFSSNKG